MQFLTILDDGEAIAGVRDVNRTGRLLSVLARVVVVSGAYRVRAGISGHVSTNRTHPLRVPFHRYIDFSSTRIGVDRVHRARRL